MAQGTCPDFDWRKFQILRSETVSDHLALEIQYEEGWTNWGGRKILLYAKTPSVAVLLKELDGSLNPHFRDGKRGPVARFEPTETGWEAALLLAEELHRIVGCS